ncbi:hypothetical protein FACS1894184_11000 [Clostridia bacterium]|nr:hypothetical protein FACS1894184_11000 [Clostridia bacterium]
MDENERPNMDENERPSVDNDIKDTTPEDDKPLFSANVNNLKKGNSSGGKGGKLRGFIWALVAVVLAGGAYFASIYLKPALVEPEAAPPSVTAEPAYLLVDKTKADFVSATVESNGQSYTMTYNGSVFAIEGMPQFMLDQTKASSLCTSLTYLYVNDIESNPTDLSLYGLAEPKAKVTARYKDGTSRVFLLGAEAPSGYRYYFKEESSPKVYTVYSSTGERYTAALASMHIVPAWTIAETGIQHMKLTRQDGSAVELKPILGDSIGISTLELVQPFRYEVDSERITELYTNTIALKLAGFDSNPQEGTLGLYGLETPRYVLDVYGPAPEPTPAPTLKPTLAPGVTATPVPATTPVPTPTPIPTTNPAPGEPSEAWLLHLEVGNQKNDSQTYVRVSNDPAIYLMDSATLSFLQNMTAPMLVDRFANIINIQKVDGFSISGMGLNEKVEISRTPSVNTDGTPRLDGNGNQMSDDLFTINGEQADDSSFRKLYQIIIGTRVDGVIPEGKAPTENTAAVLTIRYTLNQVRETETIEYLPYDSDYYAVRRNGETLFYILKTRVQMIPDALNAYHDGTFVPANFGV